MLLDDNDEFWRARRAARAAEPGAVGRLS